MVRMWIWILLLFPMCEAASLEKNIPTVLQEAYDSYAQGEVAKTLSERKEAFNRALNLYTEMEKKYDAEYSSGRLYYDIANTYFQLEEYSWAVLYYYRAQKLMPREEKLKHNLTTTQAKLGIEPEPDLAAVFHLLLFFHSYLSLPERLQLFLLVSLCSIAALSAYLWRPQRWLKITAVVFLIATTLLVLSLAYTRYLSPIEGVLIQSTNLYRGAGEQYAPVSEQPTLSGNKLTIVEVLSDGKWLKVITPLGELGYIPYAAVRII